MNWATEKAREHAESAHRAFEDAVEDAIRQTIRKCAAMVAPADSADEMAKIVLAVAQQSILGLLRDGPSWENGPSKEGA